MSREDISKAVIVPPFTDEEFLGLVIDDTTTFDGDVDGYIKKHPVVMFATTTCPFCMELKRTLQYLGVEFHIVNIEKISSTVTTKTKLKALSGIVSVPQLFVNGNFIGGCMDAKEKAHTLELQTILAPYVKIAPRSERNVDRIHSTRHFRFPETSNSNAAMAMGFLSMAYCILCIAYYKDDATPWAVLALGIDFFIRLLAGPTASPIGVAGLALSTFFKPRFFAGPPKQFAAFCGFFMATFSAGLFLSDQRLGGVIILGALIFPTALEGLFDFCLGCWMYGIAISLKIVPASIYHAYLSLRHERKWAYDFAHSDKKYPSVSSTHLLLPGQTTETPVDIIRKSRFESE